MPVYATLEQDPQTGAFIDRIEALKRSIPGGPVLEIPHGCEAVTGDLDLSEDHAETVDPCLPRRGRRQDRLEGEEPRDPATVPEDHAPIRTAGFQVSFRPDGGGTITSHLFYGSTYEIADNGTLLINTPHVPTLENASCHGTYRYMMSGDHLRLHVVKQCSASNGPYGTALIATFPMTRQHGARQEGSDRRHVDDGEHLAERVASMPSSLPAVRRKTVGLMGCQAVHGLEPPIQRWLPHGVQE